MRLGQKNRLENLVASVLVLNPKQSITMFQVMLELPRVSAKKEEQAMLCYTNKERLNETPDDPEKLASSGWLWVGTYPSRPTLSGAPSTLPRP